MSTSVATIYKGNLHGVLVSGAASAIWLSVARGPGRWDAASLPFFYVFGYLCAILGLGPSDASEAFWPGRAET